MTNSELLLNWNKALFDHFFVQDLEEDEEVSLFINRETIDEIGHSNGIGGYEDFMCLIMQSIKDRQQVYSELRTIYVGTKMSDEQKIKYNCKNLFDFSTIYIDNAFNKNLGYPLYLVYVVFAVLMGSECYREGKSAIGGYITERLREFFPDHTERRNSLDVLFNSLANEYPHFYAKRLTDQQYIGLIKYQLGLSKTQEESLKKAMYGADLSEELPYEIWVDKIIDYVDSLMKGLLKKSKTDTILRHRISSLRSSFDPVLYEQKHHNEEFCSKGKFVLAVYEDDYTADDDRLVLLTDINNKSITNGHLIIEKGCTDRLGEYAQYNINHVRIGNDYNDKAEMKSYSLKSGDNNITSETLGNIVTFSRYSSNYLIQTKYPQKGKETYILVKKNCEEAWEKWLSDHGSPNVRLETNSGRICQIFGNGWDMYISNEIEYVPTFTRSSNSGSTIIMDGGIRCVGMNKVYLINALPYFEFPEPINLERLEICINIDNSSLDDNQYDCRIVDNTKLVIDILNLKICNHSLEVSITIEYKRENDSKKRLYFHDDFSILGQDISYNDNVLFPINMWGNIKTNGENISYMKGFQLFSGKEDQPLPKTTVLYQNTAWLKQPEIDIYDQCFYLVNLFAAVCSMRKSFSATDNQLKKCIRYAASRFSINIMADGSFYRDVKYMLINSGYINADFENGIFQPIPPTFIETPIAMYSGKKLYMLIGSYTLKFLYDLKMFCNNNKIQIFLHSLDNPNSGGRNVASELMPPVILLQYNFNPEGFMKEIESKCVFIPNVDVAINILNSLPSYKDYEKTLELVSSEVVGRLDDPSDDDFPRLRYSKATGFGSSKWIEKKGKEFYRITLADIAWAKMYCHYQMEKTICTKEVNSLLFPIYMHLPVMMQRALYITNLGAPKREKVFICYNDNNSKGYYNIIKRYEIKDSVNSTRLPRVIKAITGKDNNVSNPSIREYQKCPYYRLLIWTNKQKQSKNPRTVLVLTDQYKKFIHGFAIAQKKLSGQNKWGYTIYFKKDPNSHLFYLVDGDEINSIFSKYMNTRGTWEQLGISFKDESMQLPPSEEYEIEEIKII